MPSSGSHSPALSGILWMLLGMSFIGLVDGIAKYVAQSLIGMQVAWGYFLGMLIALLICTLWRRFPPVQLIRSTRPLLQIVRAGCLVGSLACLFSGLRFLPLAEATSISFMSPLFVVALAGPILGEHVSWQRWIAVLIGLGGTLLVVRPGSVIFQWVAILPLIGALFFAMFSIVTKQLGNTDSPVTTLFYTFGAGTLMLSIPLPLIWRTPSAADWAWLMLSGVLGLIAHFAIVRSLAYAHASLLAPLNYARLIWAITIGFFVFGQLPDTLALLGSTAIIGSGLYVVYSANSN